MLSAIGMKRIFALAMLTSLPVAAQEVTLRDAHVNLWFPHLADGGTPGQQWQTWFTFVNPESCSVDVTLYLYGNDGSPLALDLGQGPASSLSFSIPPLGRRTFRSRITSATILTGWASASATRPIQATLMLREFSGGKPIADLSAPATLPTTGYESAANRNLGIALANVYADTPISVRIGAFDQQGVRLGSWTLTLSPREHRSFNLWQVFPALPTDYLGSIQIWSDSPSRVFLGWTLNEDGGLLSTLPSGRLEWPVSHWDRIWLVYQKALNAARLRYRSVDFNSPPVTLRITRQWFDESGIAKINASSYPDGTVWMPYSLCELISDSESELGFIAAHEIGHQVQYRMGTRGLPAHLYNNNSEIDADIIALQLSLDAGFDAYAAAGALGKLTMAAGAASLQVQSSQDHQTTDPHPSWGTRIDTLWSSLLSVCQIPDNAQACSRFKSVYHPDFPGSTPLRSPDPNKGGDARRDQ